MSKAFWIALVVNLCLLIGYEVVYSIQMFDFVWKTVRPSSMSFSWTPFFLSMSFGSTIDTGEGMLYADGWVLIPNYIFFLLVAMVCFNLILIWRLEKTKPDSNAQTLT